MPEYTQIDDSIHEQSTLHDHPQQTTPQGTQFDGVLKGHEHRDVSVRSISVWFFGLFCFTIVAAFGLVGLFFGILHYQARSDQVPSALFKSPVKLASLSQEGRLIENEKAESYLPTPTQPPALMPDPHQPMVVLRHQEDQEVNSYGNVESAEGNKVVGVHIPITAAMAIALQKGFPVDASPSSLRPPAPVSPALEPAEDKGF